MDARVGPAHDAACNSKSSDQHDEHKVSSLLQRFSMQPGALFGEAAENEVCDGRSGRQRVDHRIHGNPRGTIGWKTIDSGGDGSKGNRRQAVGLAQLHGAAVTRRQRLVLAFAAAVPDRSDGMNDMPRRKPVAMGDLGIAGLAAAKCAALRDQPRSGGAMDCTIDPASAEQRGIRGVDDGVNAQCGDVGDDDFKPRRTDVAGSRCQAEAGAAVVTPLSANNCCSSPAWNISRMMSQPPTNSPLT
jgi:hypothetical protein